MFQRCIAIFTALFVIVWPQTSFGFTDKDVEVAARVLPFVEGISPGSVNAAIVFDPASADSKAAADALHGKFSRGASAGKFTITTSLVELGSLGGLDGNQIAFVTTGLSNPGAVFDATKSRNLLSITDDMSCIDAGNCVMGVQSQPSVEIVVSKAAAEASSIVMSQALRMMIKER